ncbi:hypothetical protein EHS39_17675 [Ensifer sp. MPMI2T]|nr:hypothetical protein EHS39_17675 [Ensifer sp. MPMI2T]
MSIVTLYSAFILFLAKGIRSPLNSFEEVTFAVAVICMLVSFLLSLWATQIARFEGVTTGAKIIDNFGDRPPSDEEFFEDRIVDYTVAHERNALVNNAKARLLLVARLLLLMGVSFHAIFFLVHVL